LYKTIQSYYTKLHVILTELGSLMEYLNDVIPIKNQSYRQRSNLRVLNKQAFQVNCHLSKFHP